MEIYDKKKYEIKLGEKERNIFFCVELDATIIEIGDLMELCDKVNFLEIDQDYKEGSEGFNKYKNKNVFTLGYPYGNKIECSPGKITEILEDKEFEHDCDTDKGYSGSPIILPKNLKVIGIHKGGIYEQHINRGIFLGIVLEKKISNCDIYRPTEPIESINYEIVTNYTKKTIKNIINAEYYIKKEDLNKEIQIINSVEADLRDSKDFKFNEKVGNEKEIKECEIEIEGKIKEFSYSYSFPHEGEWKIKFTYYNNLKNLSSMFKGCEIIKAIDFTNFNTNEVTNMSNMFLCCSSLESINLSKCIAQKVTNMQSMFSGCSKLRSVNLTEFFAPNVTNMSEMFKDCKSLKTIDLSDLKCQNVIDMNYMFNECSSLTEINLSNFNTQNATDLSCMFSRCSSLKSIDLSKFNTDKVENMSYMFCKCSSLKSINLSNFHTQNVTDMSYMFSKCSSLAHINLSNFNIENVKSMIAMFNECSSLTYLDLSNFKFKDKVKYEDMISKCFNLKISHLVCHDDKLLEIFSKILTSFENKKE